METTASEVLISRLADWGVDTVFGPGDGINGLMEGMRRNAEPARFLLVHDEEVAAVMETAFAKATGRVGVCLATSGPDGIHLANGLYDAALDPAPVPAITGMTGVSSPGRTVTIDAGADNRQIVLEKDVVVGSVNANLRHCRAAADAPAKADLDWLQRLITRRVPLEHFADALTDRPDDIKVVLTPADRDG